MGNFTSSYFIMKSVCTEIWKGPHSHWFAAVINYGSALTGRGWCARSFHQAGPEGHSTPLCLGLAMLSAVLWSDLNLEVDETPLAGLWFANTSSHHGWTNIVCELNHILRYLFFLTPPPPPSCSTREQAWGFIASVELHDQAASRSCRYDLLTLRFWKLKSVV